MVPWVLCTIWKISGHRSTFGNLEGLMLYLCSSGSGFRSLTTPFEELTSLSTGYQFTCMAAMHTS